MEKAFPGVLPGRTGVKLSDSDFVPINPAYAWTRGNPNQIEVVFTAPVDPVSATAVGNYSVDPGASVLRAEMGIDAYTVVLTTTTLPDTIAHSLTVDRVKDRSSPANTVPANSRVAILKGQGVITRRVFNGIGANWLESLTNNVNFPNNPDFVSWPASFEVPANQGDYYGTQLIGYLHPPVTGDYMFYLSSDNQSVLYLGLTRDPSSKVAIATVPDFSSYRQWNKYASQRSGYVHLIAGESYYIEALAAESFGEDHLSVAWRMRGMPEPVNGDPPIPGDFLSSVTPSGPAGVLDPPRNITVQEGQTATFAVVPSGTPPWTYQWTRNGFPIQGATGNNHVTPALSFANNGEKYAVIVGNRFSSVTSVVATVTVVPDLTPPSLLGVSGSATLNKVRLTFSERLDAESATNTCNYSISGGLKVLDASLLPDGTNVVLTTSLQTSGQTYTVIMTDIADAASARNRLSTSTTFAAWVLCRGFVHTDVFSNIGGCALTDLLLNPAFPDAFSASGELATFERPSFADNYGQRISGWLLPPVTGYYFLYIASDDQSALYFSPDEEPANKMLVASTAGATGWRIYNASASQRSQAVWLEAGRKYYIEALQKECAGNDYVNVTWQLPDQPVPANGAPPIPAAYLLTAANPATTSLAFTRQPENVVVEESNTATFSVAVTTQSPLVFYQWQRNGIDVLDANSSNYVTPRLLRTDEGAQYRCIVAVPGICLTSAPASVVVIADAQPPSVVSAATLFCSTNIGVCFSELMDSKSTADPANYTLSIQGRVMTATLRSGGRSAALGVTAIGHTNYTVQVRNLNDYAGNPMQPASVPVAVLPLQSTDIGVPGDPLERGSTFTCRAWDFDVEAGGTDFWGTGDRGHFVYQTVEGDFDVAVRVEQYAGANTYSRAGLMARESLDTSARMVNVTMFPTTGANRYEAHWRTTVGGNTGGWPGPYQYGFPGVGVPLPNAWVRLTRTNDVFTAFASNDGTNWVQFSQTTFALPARLHVGMATSAQNNSAGAVVRVSYRDYRLLGATITPALLDLAIKRAIDPPSAFALDNVYQSLPTGAQVLDMAATSTRSASFHVRVQNDTPSPQSPVLRAVEENNTGWTAIYRQGGSNITAAITSPTGHTIENLPVNGTELIEVELRPVDRIVGASRMSTTISVAGDRNAGFRSDTVRAEAINEVGFQPDLMVRGIDDVLYIGEGIYNLTGADQTRHIQLTPCGPAAFAVRLLNAGNITNTFILTAKAGDSGWSVRYFDGLTSTNDLTADLTGAGVYVTLNPGASWETRVVVDALPIPGGSASASFNVTARSTANTTRADVVVLSVQRPPSSLVPMRAVYASGEDFAMGTMIGTTAGDGMLTLQDRSVTRPFIWVPNSNEGTVSKVDTRTGNELGRYRVCPVGVTGNPSRTTIDQYGNCWVANRQSGTAVKIGLIEAGEYIDRNGNGQADTSRDIDGDGNITGSEILPWGQDECVLFEVVVIPGKEGVFAPGTFSGGYANDYWNPGPRGMAIDSRGNLWCGTWGTMKYYYIDGTTGAILKTVDVASPVQHHPYGAVIDSHGKLWSSGYNDNVALNNLLLLEPDTGSITNFNLGHQTYGLGIDRQDHLYVAGFNNSVLTRMNVVTLTRDWTISAPYQSRGVAVTDDGDVWVANSAGGTVTRYSNDGVYKTTITVGNTPTGVSVDADGKVWVVNNGDEYIKRIDPNTDTITLSKRIIGGTHYGYSDMTGVIARNTTTRFGTWTVTHDALVELTQWGTVAWTAIDPAGDGVRVRVRSANLCEQWSAWETATNGVPLAATPPGRFLQIEVALSARVGDTPPMLLDLTADPLPRRTADLAVTLNGPFGPFTNDHLASWTIAVSNRGPNDARGVVLTNWFPANLTLLSVTNSEGILVQTAGAVRVDVAELKSGAGFTSIVTGVWNTAGQFTNIAAVSHFEQDPALSNNSASSTGFVNVNPCVAPPDGLIGWWPAEGDANDLAGSYNGVLVNGATFAQGRSGLAFAFSGNNAYVDLGRVSPGTRWSLEAWVNLSSVPSGRRAIFGCHADCRDWSLVCNEGVFGVNIGRGSCVAIVSSGVKAVANTWYHLVGTYDGTNGTIYVDGVARNSEQGAINYVGSSSGLRIGGSVCCGEYIAGLVDEASLYNRALTPAEVFALYDAGKSGKCKPLGAPTLNITLVEPGVCRLSWPAAASGYRLEFAPDLGAQWQSVPGTPVVQGTELVLPVPTAGVTRFFRLTKP
ncbi:MAG: hypothetical protein GX456_12490 [Verrucomicrobia bacterium]|nr:hypothetical protein [Verrucomicrobiota bacterium]